MNLIWQPLGDKFGQIGHIVSQDDAAGLDVELFALTSFESLMKRFKAFSTLENDFTPHVESVQIPTQFNRIEHVRGAISCLMGYFTENAPRHLRYECLHTQDSEVEGEYTITVQRTCVFP